MMLQIRQAQMDTLLACKNADFESEVRWILQTEGNLGQQEAAVSADSLIHAAPQFRLMAYPEILRLAFLCARYFGGFGGRPPLTPAALRILYSRTPNALEKLDRLEQLGKSSEGDHAS